MTEKAVEAKAEPLPDLDDLLQCPVCYEIPAGQIFQCNEGHHVCGRCKLRLDVCPVCRAFFFGTRNYAMEELIANIRKLRAFKLGGKVTTGDIASTEQNVEVKESTSEDNESTHNDEDGGSSAGSTNRTPVEPPRPCSGLFRCLCCKTNPERLPSARLLNHLRYFHSPELIEGRSDDNGEYLQAWQFSTDEGRIVTAVRIADMGLFFLVIEITDDSVFAWLVMAASPMVSEEFSYTFTLSGNDREAIFSDCVWSVRTCEGFLKKRQRCLSVAGADARALLSPTTMSAKLSLRRTPLDVVPSQAQPRAVLRVANRSARDPAAADPVSQELEPFLQDLQNDVARLSRAFANLGREANALVRSEAEMRARLELNHRPTPPPMREPPSAPQVVPEVAPPPEPIEPLGIAPLSRNARRRMRQRLRQAFRENQTENVVTAPLPVLAAAPIPAPAAISQVTLAGTNRTENAQRQTNGQSNPVLNNNNNRVPIETTVAARPTNSAQTAGNNARVANNNANSTRTPNNHGDRASHNNELNYDFEGLHAIISEFQESIQSSEQAPAQPRPAASNGNTAGRNKKKRRQRR